MIDYKKLQIAHETLNNYASITKEENYELTIQYNKTRNEYSFLVDCGEYDDNFHSLDDLINFISELTQPEKPKPKYAIGDKVWRLNDEYEPVSLIITEIDVLNDYLLYLEHQEFPEERVRAGWLEEQLYPSREALIDAQLKYWQNLKDKP